MGRPTNEMKEKREIARKKVEKLLGGGLNIDVKEIVGVANKLDELQQSPTTVVTNSEGDWFENQLKDSTKKIEELENKLLVSIENYNKLLNSGTVSEAPDGNVENEIKAIFNDLRNNYEGNNQSRQKYLKADIRILLEKFLQSFPFLRK